MLEWLAILVIGGSLFHSSKTYAHQDRIFKIGPDGKIEGIPEKFGEVKLLWSADQPPELHIGPLTSKFPPCIAKLFAASSREQIRALGSWYHARGTLPAYLNFELPESGTKEKEYWNGHTILFNLETAEVIEIQRVTSDPQQRSHQYKTLALKDLCSKAEIDALTPKKK